MNGPYDIADRILQLLDTIGEGLEYLHSRLQEGIVEENRYLIEDLGAALQAVKASLAAANDLAIDAAAAELGRCLEELDRAYSGGEVEKARFEMQITVMPAFKRWEQLLRSYLTPAAHS